MQFQFDNNNYSIFVDSINVDIIKHFEKVYDVICSSSVGPIVNSFFQEFERTKYNGKVITKWNWDEITFSFKDGQFHSYNKNHAAISSERIKVFLQNGKFRTREFGPCCSIKQEKNKSKWGERFYIDEEKSYGVDDYILATQFVKGTSTHIEKTLLDLFSNYKPKYGAKYIKRGLSKIHRDFGNAKLSNEIEKYLVINNLKYEDISKNDWELIMFQCNIMVK